MTENNIKKCLSAWTIINFATRKILSTYYVHMYNRQTDPAIWNAMDGRGATIDAAVMGKD